MTKNQLGIKYLFPVLLTFIVMGFVDIVGLATGFVKKDFQLSDSVAQFLPSMVFVWFFICSIPIGIWQDRIGKKRMMTIGIVITIIGLLLPFMWYSFAVMLASFALIGIGNTIIQVSANPLLQEVTPKEKLSSFLSLSQFIKAITSLLGPIIATYVAASFGDWKFVLLVYAIVAGLSLLWLQATPIKETSANDVRATFKSCMALLKNGFIFSVVMAIFLIVGADVGMNSNIQGLLMENHGISIEQASYGISIYFTALMISRFLGAILLQFLKPVHFLIASVGLALIGMGILFSSDSLLMSQIAIFVIGFGAGNLFPLVFSIAIDKMPERSNEISGLLIMAIVGGAVLPPVMGLLSQYVSLMAAMSVLVVCFVYVLLLGLKNMVK
ncbi:MAG: MFS transporter [Flavobacteriaceae bacterium]|nr:MAG: MFS transporter [Flavobacteriaceae bacterium]